MERPIPQHFWSVLKRLLVPFFIGIVAVELLLLYFYLSGQMLVAIGKGARW
jgi:hypothetical protein